MESDFYFYLDFQKSRGGWFILKIINKQITALHIFISKVCLSVCAKIYQTVLSVHVKLGNRSV